MRVSFPSNPLPAANSRRPPLFFGGCGNALLCGFVGACLRGGCG